MKLSFYVADVLFCSESALRDPPYLCLLYFVFFQEPPRRWVCWVNPPYPSIWTLFPAALCKNVKASLRRRWDHHYQPHRHLPHPKNPPTPTSTPTPRVFRPFPLPLPPPLSQENPLISTPAHSSSNTEHSLLLFIALHSPCVDGRLNAAGVGHMFRKREWETERQRERGRERLSVATFEEQEKWQDRPRVAAITRRGPWWASCRSSVCLIGSQMLGDKSTPPTHPPTLPLPPPACLSSITPALAN